MKTIPNLVIGLFTAIVCCTTVLSQTGWYPQSSNTVEHLFDVQFLNSNTGYACGKFGTFLKTTNGGINWIQTITSSSDFARISFLNVATGWAINGGFRGEDSSFIKKTTDGGYNFVNQYFLEFGNNPDGWNNDIELLSMDTLFIISKNDLFRTTNSGTSWQYIGNTWQKVSFANSTTGYRIETGSGAILSKTTNTGTNWFSIYVFATSSPTPIYFNFLNPATGCIVSERLSFYKTSNGGNNWQIYPIVNNPNYIFRDAFFHDLNTGWAVTYAPDSAKGLVFKTTNGGFNWFPQYVGTDQEIRAVSFIDANTGWIVGYNGIIYKTTNGGGNPIGIQQLSSIVPKKYGLSQNYPNPFNPSTSIHLQIIERTYTKLIIYDVKGKELATLVSQNLDPGEYEYTWEAVSFPSGVYFYTLETESYRNSKKMVLIK